MAEKNVLYGQPNDPMPDISVGEFLYNKLRENHDRPLFIEAKTGNVILYGDLLESSLKVANALKKRGVTFGDRVCISAENSYRWFVPFCATVYLGAIVAPINPTYTAGEITHTLSVSKPRLVFVSRRTEKLISEVARKLPWKVELIELDDEALSKDVPTLKSILSEEKYLPDPLQHILARIPRTDKHEVAIFCSSGTTGLPKGVALSHNNLMLALLHIPKPEYMNVQREDKLSGFLPFYHGYGASIVLFAITAGAQVVLLPSFDVDSFVDSVRKYRMTHLTLVPPILVLLVKHPRATKADFVSIKEVVCGAAPISQDAHDKAKEKLGFKHIRNAYGMTELSIIMTMTKRTETDLHTVGHVFPGTFLKFVNPETQEILGPHKVGELCVNGPRVMLGYYGNPKATEETIDSNNWLHTGDLGYFDETNRIFVIDRLKELIKYKAFQVAPAELENVLLSHPGVKDAAAVGKPDEEAGELPMAFVVRQPGSKVTAEEIDSFVKERLSPQKWLRGGVRFIEAIPKNPTGKILRRELKKLISNL